MGSKTMQKFVVYMIIAIMLISTLLAGVSFLF
ncbi:MAG: stressosome-associated protein Prli42 [Bacillus sp. (in: firmicutes)]